MRFYNKQLPFRPNKPKLWLARFLNTSNLNQVHTQACRRSTHLFHRRNRLSILLQVLRPLVSMDILPLLEARTLRPLIPGGQIYMLFLARNLDLETHRLPAVCLLILRDITMGRLIRKEGQLPLPLELQGLNRIAYKTSWPSW